MENAFSEHIPNPNLLLHDRSNQQLATVFKGKHGFDVGRLSADVAQPPPSFSARWRSRPSSRQDARVAGEGDAFLRLLLLSGDESVGKWMNIVHSFWWREQV